MFKAGDEVRKKHFGTYEMEIGSVHTIKAVDTYGNLQMEGNDSRWWSSKNFELTSKNNNPCITTEVVTTTKRTLVAAHLCGHYWVKPTQFNGTRLVQLRGDNQLTSVGLRNLARQLNEIADVLDET